ncbi:hypothetical protein B0H12DRAFT_1224349, partial [Mycena haematopus]
MFATKTQGGSSKQSSLFVFDEERDRLGNPCFDNPIFRFGIRPAFESIPASRTSHLHPGAHEYHRRCRTTFPTHEPRFLSSPGSGHGTILGSSYRYLATGFPSPTTLTSAVRAGTSSFSLHPLPASHYGYDNTRQPAPPRMRCAAMLLVLPRGLRLLALLRRRNRPRPSRCFLRPPSTPQKPSNPEPCQQASQSLKSIASLGNKEFRLRDMNPPQTRPKPDRALVDGYESASGDVGPRPTVGYWTPYRGALVAMKLARTEDVGAAFSGGGAVNASPISMCAPQARTERRASTWPRRGARGATQAPKYSTHARRAPHPSPSRSFVYVSSPVLDSRTVPRLSFGSLLAARSRRSRAFECDTMTARTTPGSSSPVSGSRGRLRLFSTFPSCTSISIFVPPPLAGGGPGAESSSQARSARSPASLPYLSCPCHLASAAGTRRRLGFSGWYYVECVFLRFGGDNVASSSQVRVWPTPSSSFTALLAPAFGRLVERWKRVRDCARFGRTTRRVMRRECGEIVIHRGTMEGDIIPAKA